MKKILLFLLTVLTTNFYASGLQVLEFQVYVNNNVNNYKVEVTSNLVSNCWDASLYSSEHNITNNYQGASDATFSDDAIGFSMSWTFGDGSSLALGKYKISVKTINQYDQVIYSDYFYIDYRTSDLPENYDGNCDVVVYWNPSNGQLYWNNSYTSSVGSNYTIWGLNPSSLDNFKTELEPYPPVDLIINNPLRAGEHPVLSWDHASQDSYWTGYNVYRKEGAGSFYKIASLSNETSSYTDESVVLNGGGTSTIYYVKAINGSRESVASNSVNINSTSIEKKGIETKNLTYDLAQNYPNPFNPETSIQFIIPLKQHVLLNVYDLQGEIVAELVNEIKSAGKYNINFSAKDLPSGIYFYSIASGSFRRTKKLIVLK